MIIKVADDTLKSEPLFFVAPGLMTPQASKEQLKSPVGLAILHPFNPPAGIENDYCLLCGELEIHPCHDWIP